jgi:hypothetical protein
MLEEKRLVFFWQSGRLLGNQSDDRAAVNYVYYFSAWLLVRMAGKRYNECPLLGSMNFPEPVNILTAMAENENVVKNENDRARVVFPACRRRTPAPTHSAAIHC